eukprot:gb/GFBE01032507.1/.p1 GENE.gb/GFBE01032507.1/~~gb/GFBE01032507.1/.p1  ORF type:complete len:389 (+),score=81.82 gb/GFBE01032507.1/:1-1167(+)
MACPAGCGPRDDSESGDDETELALLKALLEPESGESSGPPRPEATKPETDESAYDDLFDLMHQGWPPDDSNGSSGAVNQKAQHSNTNGKDSSNRHSANVDVSSNNTALTDNSSKASAQDGEHSSSSPPKRPVALTAEDLAPRHSKRQRVESQAIVPGAVDDGPPLPERVADAYALLDVPLTATAADVQRQSRRLARKRHPDKAPPEQRARAARLFRQLQEAKDTVLSWLQERAVPMPDESSESAGFESDAENNDDDVLRRPDDGEAGDVMAEFEDDGSGSEGEREDEKAVGVHAARGDSPATEADSDESADEQAEAALVLSARRAIRTEDSALVQATALSHFLAAPSSLRQQTCSECWQAKVPKGTSVCKKCKKEIRQLKRCLGSSGL